MDDAYGLDTYRSIDKENHRFDTVFIELKVLGSGAFLLVLQTFDLSPFTNVLWKLCSFKGEIPCPDSSFVMTKQNYTKFVNSEGTKKTQKMIPSFSAYLPKMHQILHFIKIVLHTNNSNRYCQQQNNHQTKNKKTKIDKKTYRALTDGGLPISSIDFLKM